MPTRTKCATVLGCLGLVLGCSNPLDTETSTTILTSLDGVDEADAMDDSEADEDEDEDSGSSDDATDTDDTNDGSSTSGTNTTNDTNDTADTNDTSSSTTTTDTSEDTTESTTGDFGNCGWYPEASYYACGFQGEDPDGVYPIECPPGLIEGDSCATTGLNDIGCCAPEGNWWCNSGTVILDPCP